MYSSQLLDHFQNPRNVGEVENADITVQLENPACGDVLKLSLKLSGLHIREIRFRAQGCAPALACASALTELAKGKTVAEARIIGRQELLKAVGGLPQASAHASQLAIDALGAALKNINPESALVRP